MRPILIAAIGYIIGILWELYLKQSIAPFLLMIIIIIIIIYYKKKLKSQRKIIRYINLFNSTETRKGIIILFVFIFIAIINIKLLDNKYNKVYKEYKGVETVYTGIVVSDEKESNYYDTYVLKIVKVDKDNANNKTDFKILLKLKKDKEPKINYGNRIIFKGILEEPSKRTNYKGYSYSEYLKSKAIYGSIKLEYKDVKILKKNNVNIISNWSNKCRNIIIKNISIMLENETKDIALGMLLGNTEEMNQEIKENFRTASLSHMLAVSGAHVSYIVLGTVFVLKKLKINGRKASITTIFVLVFFMFLTDFTPSITRACIMGICVMGSELVYRQSDFINSISIAILIILIKNPFSFYNVGIKLSFGGVIGIILFQENIKILLDKIVIRKNKLTKHSMVIETYKNSLSRSINKILQIIKEMLAVTISAQIIIMPIIILEFNTISLTFFISNILVIPFMGIIIIGGFLLVFISIISIKLAIIFGPIYNKILKLLIYVVNICSKIPLSKIYVITISNFIVSIYYVVVFLINYSVSISMKQNRNRFEKSVFNLLEKINFIMVKYCKKIKVIAIVLIVLIIAIKPISEKFRNLKLYFVDVGQGDCTVIVTPDNKKIVIDGGGSNTENSTYDVGKQILFPYLLDRKIIKLDYIIISHFDSDHCMGLMYVLKNMKVKNVIIPMQFKKNENYNKLMQIVKEKRIKVIEVKAGDKIKLGKYVYIKILWPTEEPILENVINNNSIVFKLYFKHFSALFTGDIEKEAEEKILNLYRDTNILKSTILKVAHHGSKTSSTNKFLEEVMPEYSLIGVGANNKFGHPSDITLANLKKKKCKIYRTDEMGEIIIQVSRKGRVCIKNLQNDNITTKK